MVLAMTLVAAAMVAIVPIISIIAVVTIVPPIIVIIVITVIVPITVPNHWRSGYEDPSANGGGIRAGCSNCILEVANQTPRGDLIGRAKGNSFGCRYSPTAGRIGAHKDECKTLNLRAIGCGIGNRETLFKI